MNEKLIELLEEVKKNEELQAKMEKAQSIDELYAVTTQYVDGYSLDELKEGLKFIKSQTSDELSDEDLEMVAGGSKNKFYDVVENTTWRDFGESVKDLFTLGL